MQESPWSNLSSSRRDFYLNLGIQFLNSRPHSHAARKDFTQGHLRSINTHHDLHWRSSTTGHPQNHFHRYGSKYLNWWNWSWLFNTALFPRCDKDSLFSDQKVTQTFEVLGMMHVRKWSSPTVSSLLRPEHCFSFNTDMTLWTLQILCTVNRKHWPSINRTKLGNGEANYTMQGGLY